MVVPVRLTPSALGAALEYATRGWRVLPLRIYGDGSDKDGKVPDLPRWQHAATCDPAIIAAWWARSPTANVGLLCDPHFGFVVDVDDMGILAFLPVLPPTLTGRTPSGGCHLVYRHPETPLGNKVAGIRDIARARGWVPQKDARGKLRGIDIRGKAGQIVVYPSSVPLTGDQWRWDDGSAPIADAPQWLIAALQSKPAVPAQALPLASSWGHVDPYIERAVQEMTRDLAGTVEGCRGGRLYAAAARLGELGVSHGDVERALVHACTTNGLVDKDGEASVLRELRRGWDQGASNPVERPAMSAPAKQRTKLAVVEAPVRVDEKGDSVKSRDRLKWVALTDKGAPISCRENVEVMLAHYEIAVRYNLMTHEDEYDLRSYRGAADKRANAGFAQLRELARKHGLSAGEPLNDQLEAIIADNGYHPVADWIGSAPWDGIDRIADLFASLTLACEPERCALMRRMFVAWAVTAAHAALVPATTRMGVAAQLVLVLQGPQGVQKTRWVQSLVPPGAEWVREGVMLDPSQRDSVQQATNVWIVELGELDATFRKADIAALKAHLTSRADTFRAAYAHKTETRARRTVYAATVNERGVLHDETGSRRFAVIAIHQCNSTHGVNLQQFWSQMATMPETACFLAADDEKALLENNQQHEATDPLTESCKLRWEVDTDIVPSWQSLRDVLEGIDADRQWTTADARAVGKVIRERMQCAMRVSRGVRQFALRRVL